MEAEEGVTSLLPAGGHGEGSAELSSRDPVTGHMEWFKPAPGEVYTGD